ncbi:hypothetical protein [Sorangium sp. So ce128]|uniref:hypothetical protein n=1 Tax=Sorangium sp. So ce128 TaxID=3133281 RepID=UPI003F63F482
MKTLQLAIDLAASGRDESETPTRRVYACGGVFEEAITLPSGVDLWGSRRCDDGDDSSEEWPLGGPNASTVIAPPVGIPVRVLGGDDQHVIAGDDVTSVIVGVRAVAADASAPDHKSSIAMILSQGARAIVQDSVIVAGNGKDGEPGKDASSERATGGELGNDGANACTADGETGALPVVTVCGDGIESTGGYGGDGGLESGGDGAPGKPEPAENPEGKGQGGTGAGDVRCMNGADGRPGPDSPRAAGAVGAGYLTVDGWIGVRGNDGQKGGIGQGGGGGGGSLSRGPMTACPANRPQGGAAGGSGGSGGCGGLGGHGGSYGGASIGVIALEGSSLALDATDVITGDGGHGGVGGTGQPGGYGQPGGQGGLGFANTPMWKACDGGWGGAGGRGGDAGGGLGGPSYGIAALSASVSFGPEVQIQYGRGGLGGLAGNAPVNDSLGRGEEGDAAAYRPFDSPDPEPPR